MQYSKLWEGWSAPLECRPQAGILGAELLSSQLPSSIGIRISAISNRSNVTFCTDKK